MNQINVVEKGQGWKEANVGESKLVCHMDGEFVGREALAAAPVPEGTKSWKPIPHLQFVSRLASALKLRGYEIEREAFALSKDGLKMFGLIDLKGDQGGEMGRAIGFRNSNDKSVAIRAYAGSRVFICDNLALSGQSVIMARKHTSRLDLDLEVGRGVEKWQIEMNRFQGIIRKMQDVKLDETQARKLIYRAFIEDEVMPLRLAKRVHDAHFGILPVEDGAEDLNEKYAAWGDQTAWRLNNAFTWAAQEMPVMSRSKALDRVGRFFESSVAAN